MNILIENATILPEVKIIKPDVFKDERGIIYTDVLNDVFRNEINDQLNFVHSKFAHSKKNVLRGIHGDFDSYKLVQCTFGKVFQVIVDCRKDSKSYLEHETYILDYKKPKMLLIPPGFGNAFLVLSKHSVYNYKLSYNGTYNDYDKQFTYKWFDKKININWPVKNPILSNRDK